MRDTKKRDRKWAWRGKRRNPSNGRAAKKRLAEERFGLAGPMRFSLAPEPAPARAKVEVEVTSVIRQRIRRKFNLVQRTNVVGQVEFATCAPRRAA